MLSLDMTALLAPSSESPPCGPDLDGTPELSALERATREPDLPSIGTVNVVDARSWPEIAQRAVSLLHRGKHLRVSAYLAQALLHSDGLTGLSAAIRLTRQLVERYWDDLYPRIGGDAIERLNSLRELWSEPLLRRLRATTLLDLPNLGQFSLNDVLVAKGARPGSGRTSERDVLRALEMVDVPLLRRTAELVDETANDLRALASFVDSRVGGDGPLEPDPLLGLLESTCGILHAQVATRSPHAGALDGPTNGKAGEWSRHTELDAQPSSGAGYKSMTLLGEAQSREDVLLLLERVCNYYDRHEPSSPVPLLIQRAMRLAKMGFMDIVRDLADKGLPQIEAIAGKPTTPASREAAKSS